MRARFGALRVGGSRGSIRVCSGVALRGSLKMSKLVLVALQFTSAFVLALPTFATPIVSVDANPGAPGIQASQTVGAASVFSVDIAVTGIEPTEPLNAFEFDLLFDPTIVEALTVVDGGFLLDPVLIVEETVGTLSVEFAAATLGAGGASGDGILATIGFQTVAPGTSGLDLENVLLSAPFGVEITGATLADGSVTALPEPSTVALLGLGLGLLRSTKRSRRRMAPSAALEGAQRV